MLENFELVDAAMATEDSAARMLAGQARQVEDTVQREIHDVLSWLRTAKRAWNPWRRSRCHGCCI